MEEIGVGLVNMQAAEIRELVYPEWTGQDPWVVVGKEDTDEHGYDVYRLKRHHQTLLVPANRLVFMKRFMESLGTISPGETKV